MIQIYYNNEYNKHKTFKSSFENEDRIGHILENLKNKNLLKCLNDFNSDLNLSFINEIQDYYLKLNFWNCEECSFQNIYSNENCIICDTSNNINIKLLSKIEGDTTCFSKDSFASLISNVNTIYSSLKDQIKGNNDGFLLIRPPGHHSNVCCDNENKDYMGFCIMNNVSIGVYYLQKFFNIKKIAIVDWDVHHGNGTQQIYYDREDVLFIDLHRYDGKFYPGTGNKSEKGENKGKNYTVNIPLEKGSDEEIYLKAFDEVIIPKLKDFEPEWIFVSCGFDAHSQDPLGGMKLENNSYKKFMDRLKIFNKRVTLFLEGGYNKKVILESIEEIITSYI
jgi:acetoin utilization deacetylase AcuC-like enzyme